MATKKVNIDIIAKDKSKQALKNVQGNLDKVKSSAGKLKAALAAVGGALVVRNILATTAEFQDLRTSLSSVTGSAEKGAEAFTRTIKYIYKYCRNNNRSSRFIGGCHRFICKNC